MSPLPGTDTVQHFDEHLVCLRQLVAVQPTHGRQHALTEAAPGGSPMLSQDTGSSALGSKLQPEAMTSSQYQAYPEKDLEAPWVREGTSTVDTHA